MFKGLLREPLLHFLLIGALLFIIYSLQNDSDSETLAAGDKQIIVSQAQIDRLAALWEKRRQRPPLPQELNGLIEFHVKEEVLNREALALGLDKDDGVIRRRLAQKMEFVFSDLADHITPSDPELAAYLQANREKFQIPARISFQQVFFSADRRGPEQAREDARLLKLQLQEAAADIDLDSAGDPFMPGQRYAELAEWEVERLFGREFSEQLFTQASGVWQGPLVSGYGLHLIYVEQIIAAQQPALEAVREKVQIEWEAEQRQQMNDVFYQDLLAQYTVVIEGREGEQ